MGVRKIGTRLAGAARLVWALALTVPIACSDTVHTLGVVEDVQVASRPPGDGTAGASGGGETGDGDAPGAPSAGAGGTPVAGDGDGSGTTPPASNGDGDGPPASPPPPPSPTVPTPPPTPIPVGNGLCRVPASHRQLDLYLMVDRSLDIPIPGAVDVMDSGIQGFVDSPAQAGTGLALLNVKSACQVDAYPEPDVAWGTLPDHGNAILSGLPPVAFNVAQAESALRAALTHTRNRIDAGSSAKQALVMLTDGLDAGFCATTSQAAIDAVVEGYTGTPSVPTYVVAVGTSGFDPFVFVPGNVDLMSLASGGGTGTPYLAEVQQGAQAVTDALTQVRSVAETCHYELPPDPGSTAALALPDEPNPLPARTGQDDCGAEDGYYLGSDEGHEFLMLCPATCDRVKREPSLGPGSLELELGCP